MTFDRGDRFAALTKACGGALTIESLTEFQQAMREYEVFMAGMREMLAPVDQPPPGFMELAGCGIERWSPPDEPTEFALAHQVDGVKGGA